MKITIAHLYPDMLNLYGDSGNILTLQKRMEKRDIEVSIVKYDINDEIDFNSTDIIYIGGGSQKDVKAVCNTLRQKKDELKDYAEKGGCILCVASSFEILGSYYQTEDETIPGLELVDMKSEYSKNRSAGDVIIQSDLISHTIVGFENHYGKTIIGNAQALGTVIYGDGNNGQDKKEGIVYKNVIGTYLHGPILPKNPLLADYIIKKAIEYRYGEEKELPPTDDSVENMAHDYIIKKYSR